MSARGKKIALILGVIVVVIILAVVIAVPMLVNVNRYRPQVVAEIESQTGMPASIGRLTLTLFPRVSIQVDNFELDNPKNFPSGYLVKAKRIYAIVDAGELLHRQAKITSLELDNPQIALISDGRGQWNYDMPRHASQASDSPSSSGAPAFRLGVISKVTIKDGQLTMSNVLPSGKVSAPNVDAKDISSELNDVDLSAFSGTASAKLKRFLVPAGADSGGWLESTAYAADAGEPLAAHGLLNARSLQFGTVQATAVKTKVKVYPHRILCDDVTFGIDGGDAAGALALDFSGANLRYNSTLKVHGVDMARLLESFPQSRGKMTGTLEGNVKLNGEITQLSDPLALMTGTGRASVTNGKLPSLQLNRNLMLLARLTSLGPAQGDPSSFSSITADFQIARSLLHSKSIKIVGNGVNVDGAGTMNLAGAGGLDYTGTAQLAAGQAGISNIVAAISGATMSNGHLSFPFDLKGTLENPRFILKSLSGSRALGGVQQLLGGSKSGTSNQSPSNLLQGITGLFGKKKQSNPPR